MTKTVFVDWLNGDTNKFEVMDMYDLLTSIQDETGYLTSHFDLYFDNIHITKNRQTFEDFPLEEGIRLNIICTDIPIRIIDEMIPTQQIVVCSRLYDDCFIKSIEDELKTPIEKWDMGFVTDLSDCFSYNYSFNRDISNWDVSGVRRMDFMFNFASSFNQPIGKWDVRNVRTMDSMFEDAESFTHSLDEWKLESINSAENMFSMNYSIWNGGPGANNNHIDWYNAIAYTL